MQTVLVFFLWEIMASTHTFFLFILCFMDWQTNSVKRFEQKICINCIEYLLYPEDESRTPVVGGKALKADRNSSNIVHFITQIKLSDTSFSFTKPILANVLFYLLTFKRTSGFGRWWSTAPHPSGLFGGDGSMPGVRFMSRGRWQGRKRLQYFLSL